MLRIVRTSLILATASAVALVGGSSKLLSPASPAGDTRAPASAKARWNACAQEGEVCVVPGTTAARVRYGVRGAYRYRRVTGSIVCSNSSFGDPKVGRAKSCSWWGAPVAPTTPTTAPATTPPTTPATTPATTPPATVTPTAPATTAPPTTTATTAPGGHGGHGGHVVIDRAKIPAPVAGFSGPRIAPSNDQPAQGSSTGQFRMTCTYSHMNFDDPIVWPGQPGASHLHVFFGNTGVNAFSTAESIATTGNSTCAGGTANRSGYWVPAMIDTRDGRPIVPTDILVYYKSDPFPGSRTQPFPFGLRMVAGDPRATGPQANLGWSCETASGEARSATIPSCPAGGTVDMGINFPSCWDGVNLDSADHRSHMSYGTRDAGSPTGVGCPASHPVQLPTLTEKIRYKVAAADDTTTWRLSSDMYDPSVPGGYSIHADWYSGWDPAVLDTWVSRCLQANRDCHGYLIGDGRTLF